MIIDERAIKEYLKRGERILFLPGARLTPAARDLANRFGLQIFAESSAYSPAPHPPHKIIVGSDHGGFDLKQSLIEKLKSAGYAILDIGTGSCESVDYPDFALQVAQGVARGKADRGIMIDTFGLASAMAANKIRGVRAAPCWNVEVAKSARGHNDANVITLGGKAVIPDLAWEMVSAFLQEPFAGGRHERRVRKIEAISRL
jgi:ribose 5-phosphate isomerase B